MLQNFLEYLCFSFLIKLLLLGSIFWNLQTPDCCLSIYNAATPRPVYLRIKFSATANDEDVEQLHYPDTDHPHTGPIYSNADIHDSSTADEITADANNDVIQPSDSSEDFDYYQASSSACTPIDYDYLSDIAENDEMYGLWITEVKSITQRTINLPGAASCRIAAEWYDKKIKAYAKTPRLQEQCVNKLELLSSVRTAKTSGSIKDQCRKSGCIK